MTLDWHTRRKLIYALTSVLLVSAVVVYLTRSTLFPAPMCTDGRQNGYELGIDCGGACALRCSQEVIPLTTKWARALRTSAKTYDLVAMVTNRNLDNATRELKYGFTIFDANGDSVKQVFGTSVAPVDGDFPILVQNVELPEPPASVIAILFDGPHYTVKEKPTSPTIKTTSTRYEPGSIPRVYATISNTKRTTVSNLRVRVLLFDMYDNAYAAGETIIPFLDKEGSREIAFTWNAPFKEAPTKIRIYPIFDPFSVSQ